MMANHPRGFAGQFARGPEASRCYLQCPLDSSLQEWTGVDGCPRLEGDRNAHVWNYQAFAVWFTDLMHDAGDVSYRGEFQRRLPRAEFERLYDSESANRLFGEFLTGLN